MWVDMKELKTTSQSSTSTVVPATSTTVCSTNRTFRIDERVEVCTNAHVDVSTTCAKQSYSTHSILTPVPVHVPLLLVDGLFCGGNVGAEYE